MNIEKTETKLEIIENNESIHCHQHIEDINHHVTKRLKAIIVICAIFMLLEIIGGFLANSLAIISDAFHLLSDLSGFFISLYSTKLSRKQPTKTMNFGYKRIEILGALLSITIIWVVTSTLVYTSINRFINLDFEINSNYMLIMSILGFLINLLMAFVLQAPCVTSEQKCHFHGHLHDEPKAENTENKNEKQCRKHSMTPSHLFEDNGSENQNNVANKSKLRTNINIRAAFIHVLGDTLQSIGVIIAALVVMFIPEYKIADPICTLLFSIIVLITTYPIARDIYHVLMESFPKQLKYDELVEIFKKIIHVKHVHNLQVWYLTADKYALNVHLAIDSNANVQCVLNECHKNLIEYNQSIENITIQLELYNQQQIENCLRCKNLQI